jgi:hypothetical protein
MSPCSIFGFAGGRLCCIGCADFGCADSGSANSSYPEPAGTSSTRRAVDPVVVSADTAERFSRRSWCVSSAVIRRPLATRSERGSARDSDGHDGVGGACVRRQSAPEPVTVDGVGVNARCEGTHLSLLGIVFVAEQCGGVSPGWPCFERGRSDSAARYLALRYLALRYLDFRYLDFRYLDAWYLVVGYMASSSEDSRANTARQLRGGLKIWRVAGEEYFPSNILDLDRAEK